MNHELGRYLVATLYLDIVLGGSVHSTSIIGIQHSVLEPMS